MSIIKGFLAGTAFFFSLTVLLVAQSITGVSIIGVKLGAQGGSGDVVGPSSSVDSEVALFSGTTGKLLKRASASGLATLTSGVLGTQTAGTTNNCVKWAAGGLLADAGSPCGSGGGGGSYAAGDGIDGTSLSSGTVAVDTTVPVLVVAGSQSLTFGSISSGAISTQTITANGAAVGDPVQMGYPATLPDGLIAIAYVSATDTITVKLYKATSGSADVSGQTFSYQVWRTR